MMGILEPGGFGCYLYYSSKRVDVTAMHGLNECQRFDA